LAALGENKKMFERLLQTGKGKTGLLKKDAEKLK